MVVGLTTWRLQLPGSASLKDKRSVVKSLKARMRQSLNVSVAETGLHDLPMTGELSACVVAVDQVQAQKVLESADRMLEDEWRVRLAGTETVFY